MTGLRATLLLSAGFSKAVCPEFPTMSELTKTGSRYLKRVARISKI